MSKITTADCKAFLGEIMSRDTSILTSAIGYNHAEVCAASSQPNLWKRESKCKPGRGLYEFEEYDVYKDGITVIRKVSDFKYERIFSLAPDQFESMVIFVVLEDAEGNLHLADYVGD